MDNSKSLDGYEGVGGAGGLVSAHTGGKRTDKNFIEVD